MRDFREKTARLCGNDPCYIQRGLNRAGGLAKQSLTHGVRSVSQGDGHLYQASNIDHGFRPQSTQGIETEMGIHQG